MHSSNAAEKESLLQYSKCTPNILQPVNAAFLTAVFFITVMERSHPTNVHSEKIIFDTSVFEKTQFVKVQFSYSSRAGASLEKSILVNSVCSVADRFMLSLRWYYFIYPV